MIKKAIECLFFVAGKPLRVERIAKILEVAKEEVESAIEALREQYTNSGLQIVEVAQGYQLCTRPEFAAYIEKLQSPTKQKLSSAALETLAIIAYKQPVTRAQIESIRGVDTSGVLKGILERKFIKIAGRKPTIGRPIIYATSEDFLIYFGLKDLSELPQLEEISPPE